MQVNSVVRKNDLYIGLIGELDQSSVDVVRTSFNSILLKDSYKKVIFDMSKLTFMDSTGIGLILSGYKRLKNRNVPSFITAPNKQIDKIIRVSGLYTIMPLI